LAVVMVWLCGCTGTAGDAADAGAQLGDAADAATDLSDAAEVGFVEIGVGLRHYCGLHASGTISCWGLDEDGQVSGPMADMGADFTAVRARDGHLRDSHRRLAGLLGN
jgi:hypothetical protein